ncbi:MarR family winged helix-turn-helix transcriptional regulator [Streptomyces sp. DH24]|uniref:MarR family winged helix-turn-helix transcriptional regulator n=1 Tax=Streptomyces sp. DH24 TaxID=3040123 RepID=UPI002441284C|nr:MarR family winged helix-turn-helix transcriptional regulator [Streptomyces sp. DH24]MDG9719033.1 MarR family winged helix-turn-helix transcriptional regulator [Streptomyces sp. DH24]
MAETAQNLPLLLAGAKRWFDDALIASMRAAGEQPLTSAQGQVFASLDADGTTVSEIARRIGVTRQTAHQAVHGLLALGLLEQVPDPSSARSRLIRVTAEGARVHRRAQATLTVLEGVLAERIGKESAAALREALTVPRGEPPVVEAPQGPGPSP